MPRCPSATSCIHFRGGGRQSLRRRPIDLTAGVVERLEVRAVLTGDPALEPITQFGQAAVDNLLSSAEPYVEDWISVTNSSYVSATSGVFSLPSNLPSGVAFPSLNFSQVLDTNPSSALGGLTNSARFGGMNFDLGQVFAEPYDEWLTYYSGPGVSASLTIDGTWTANIDRTTTTTDANGDQVYNRLAFGASSTSGLSYIEIARAVTSLMTGATKSQSARFQDGNFYWQTSQTNADGSSVFWNAMADETGGFSVNMGAINAKILDALYMSASTNLGSGWGYDVAFTKPFTVGAPDIAFHLRIQRDDFGERQALGVACNSPTAQFSIATFRNIPANGSTEAGGAFNGVAMLFSLPLINPTPGGDNYLYGADSLDVNEFFATSSVPTRQYSPVRQVLSNLSIGITFSGASNFHGRSFFSEWSTGMYGGLNY